MNRKFVPAILVTSLATLALVVTACNKPSEPAEDGSASGSASASGAGQKSTAMVDAKGSTFVKPFLDKVFEEHTAKGGLQVNYQGGGSGAGITAFIDGTVPFAASDAPMSDEELKKAAEKGMADVKNVPIVLGSLAIAYNIPNMAEGLQLDGTVLAEIFMGKITKWNDPKIVALNAGKTLPDLAIIPVVRADGSGSTYVLSDYLSAVDATWKSTMGISKQISWPETVQKKPKSDGVTNGVKDTPGAIGYVELGFAKEGGLSYAAIKNAAGKFVLPSAESVTAAAAGAKLPADFRGSIVNASGDGAYPISSYVYAILPNDLSKNANGTAIIDALKYVVGEGQSKAEELNYSKLPESVAKQVTDVLTAVKVK